MINGDAVVLPAEGQALWQLGRELTELGGARGVDYAPQLHPSGRWGHALTDEFYETWQKHVAEQPGPDTPAADGDATPEDGQGTPPETTATAEQAEQAGQVGQVGQVGQAGQVDADPAATATPPQTPAEDEDEVIPVKPKPATRTRSQKG